MLGNFDTDSNEREKAIKDGRVTFCNCCGMIQHEDKLPVCSSELNTIENIGITALLYFEFLKQMGYLMFTNALLYSAYSIITNIYQQNLNSLDDITQCL